MCGIVGVIGKIGPKEKTMFKRMLEFDTSRGPHSTGIIVVDEKYKVETDKAVGTPWDLYEESKMFGSRGDLLAFNAIALIGHNRWATHGKVIKENAHPFDFNNVVGVHNGTIDAWNHKFLREKGNDHPVDSHMLYEAINNVGLKETINNVSGHWSLAYWDKVDKQVVLFRNKTRPMFYIWSEDKKNLFFASEDWMIITAASLANIKLQGGPISIAPDYKYFIPLDKIKEKVEFFYDSRGKIEAKKEIRICTMHNTLPSKEVGNIVNKDGRCAVYFNDKKSSINPGANVTEIVLHSLKNNDRVKMWAGTNTSLEDIKRRINSKQGFYWAKINAHSYLTGDTVPTFYANYSDLIGPIALSELPADFFDKKEEEVEEVDEDILVQGRKISKKKFESVINDGCACCGTIALTEWEKKNITWIDFPVTWMCPTCNRDSPLYSTVYGNW